MSQPTKDEIRRSLGDLGTAAAAWTTQGERLSGLAAHYRSHLAEGLTFGLFAAYGMAYAACIEQMAETVAAGGQCVSLVGLTLAKVKTQYQRDEEANVHLIQGRW